MKIENGILKNVLPQDLAKDGWFFVRRNVLAVDEYAFSEVKLQLCKVVFENGCQVIGHHAFENCTNLTGVLLPKSLLKIEAGAFLGCGLARIDIPENVKEIENAAFWRCNALKTVIFRGNADLWTHHRDGKHDGTLLHDSVFGCCKNIEQFIYHKQPVFERGFTNEFDYDWHKKAQIVVLDENEAADFWQKSLSRNPLSYKFLDDERATQQKYAPFRKFCRQEIEKFYLLRGGLDAESLTNSAMKIDRIEAKTK